MGTRKSSASAAARRNALERAAERAARFQEREQKLLDLATDYAEAEGELEAIANSYVKRIEKLREEQAAEEQSIRAKLGLTVTSMVDLGVDKDEAAERLGITRARVNEAIRETKNNKSSDSEPSANDASSVAEKTTSTA